jgi:hypothetical protein
MAEGYKKVNFLDGTENTTTIVRTDTNEWIDVNNNNRHYQRYLEWVAEGNTIEEAD